jgi:hypothetical protein
MSEAATGWAIAKDAMAFFGAISLAVPWIIDYVVRVRRQNAAHVPTTLEIKGKIIKLYEGWLVAPKGRDLILTACGISLLTLSFLISLLQSLGVVPG